MLQTPAIHTRLISRLTIGRLHPVMQRHHIKLLKLTQEETELLLRYMRNHKFPGGLDPVKFMKAISVLFTSSDNISSSQIQIIAQHTVDLILLPEIGYDVLEGALYLLWTLCNSPDVALYISLEHKIVYLLTSMKESQSSEVATLARSVLWKLYYGKKEGDFGRAYNVYKSSHSIQHVKCLTLSSTLNFGGVPGGLCIL